MSMQMANGSAALAQRDAVVERVIVLGDLSELSPRERSAYYLRVCESVGLNPATQPFMYVRLNGKLQLYATKNCTDQLRQIHGVSVVSLARDTVEGIHIVTATVVNGAGRRDEDVGAVTIAGLKGESLANALMKATTKAKRRATLSLCGLSFLDESELETVKGAKIVQVTADGEIIDEAPAKPSSEPDLTRQLAASVEQNWPKWASGAMSALREASKHGMGALQEMWSEVYTEMQKLNPPADVRREVTEAKEELKSSLKGGAK